MDINYNLFQREENSILILEAVSVFTWYASFDNTSEIKKNCNIPDHIPFSWSQIRQQVARGTGFSDSRKWKKTKDRSTAHMIYYSSTFTYSTHPWSTLPITMQLSFQLQIDEGAGNMILTLKNLPRTKSVIQLSNGYLHSPLFSPPLLHSLHTALIYTPPTTMLLPFHAQVE